MSKAKSSLKPIMISGYYGFGNCGDEAILMVMVQKFSKYIPKDKIIVLSHKPEKTKSLYHVNSIYRLNLFSIIYRLRQSGAFISGGGGLLQDVSGKGFSVLYYLGLIFLARLCNVPIIIYGQGIGPIKNAINKKLVYLAFKNVNMIIVRDSQSKDFLEKIGILNKKIIVNADTTFLLKKKEIPDEVNQKYGLKNMSNRKTKNPRIGVVIRNCPDIAKDYDKKITELAKISDYLIERYLATLFFIPFQLDTDVPIIKDVVKNMKFTQVKIIREELSPDVILSLISELSILIGMRLHSIIFATITDTPFIAIDYDPKVKKFMYSINLPELLININQLTVKNIDNKLKYIDVHREMIQSNLETKRKQFKLEAFSNVQLFYNFIENKCLRKESDNN
jgi:polysaccharide pyruvyl transferase CsaB